MNRSKIQLEEILDLKNCVAAIKNASRNKHKQKAQERRRMARAQTANGLNDIPRKGSIVYILGHIDEYAERLQKFLVGILNGKTHLRQGVITTIKGDGTRRKERELCKPLFFPDQCAHWAIMQVVNPVLERSFYKYTCASVKGRGTHYARRAVLRCLQDTKGTKYCGQFDIKGFYRNIDKGILVELFKRKIKDKRIIALLSAIVYSYKGEGLPLGYYPSAPFANFYLTGFDRYAKECLHIRYMVRYMDDIVIFGGNKRELHKARKSFETFLSERRHLHLKDNWQIYKMPYDNGRGYIQKQRATDFIGFRFFRYKTIIRKSIFLRMTRLYRRLRRGAYTLHNAYAFVSYQGYLKYSDSENIKRHYINGFVSRNKIKEIISNENKYKNNIYGASARIPFV